METIKVKVIDLYNKIANSKDEDYKKIKFIFNDYTYTWNEYKCDYDSENTAHLKTGILGYLSIDKDQLNREIEIIEDTSKEDKVSAKDFLDNQFKGLYPKEDKKIENEARFQYSIIPNWFDMKELIKIVNENFERHQKAIYEIIEKVNGE